VTGRENIAALGVDDHARRPEILNMAIESVVQSDFRRFGRPPMQRPNVRGCQPLRLIEMRRTFFASADFGTVIVSIPFLNVAELLSSSTSCNGMRRSKRP
jgi:hypothetical protein